MVKKTWNKSKVRVFICGYCNYCNKELLNNEGGWIINGEKKHYCHDGRDGSCFDKYIKEKQYAGSLWKKNEEANEQEKQDGQEEKKYENESE
jgi:hypothetical protein